MPGSSFYGALEPAETVRNDFAIADFSDGLFRHVLGDVLSIVSSREIKHEKLGGYFKMARNKHVVVTQDKQTKQHLEWMKGIIESYRKGEIDDEELKKKMKEAHRLIQEMRATK